MRSSLALVALLLFSTSFMQAQPADPADACIDCHSKKTPNIVSDWKLSKHSSMNVTCVTCHTDPHESSAEPGKKKTTLPTPDTCKQCHETQVEQYRHGKHSKAWAAMMAMPTIHWQPMAMIEGQKGCGGCHKIGEKPAEEIAKLRSQGNEFGSASCDSCHTRHTFSVQEAKSPQACETCHMGFDHPQWEMYSSSKHGVREDLKQRGILPKDAAAPTCQTCHMQDGDHGVRTAWGFLAVRLPMPEDQQWAADRATILQALGVLDPSGKPTDLVKTVQAADLARLTQEDWQKERDKMLKTCNQCHSGNFAKQQLQQGDDMIRNADHLMAQAINIVAGLYKDGIVPQPKNYNYAFPNLLTFHDAPTVVEQKLFVMYLEHRMRTFQGTFHASPDYALWYGWSEMQRDLTEIRELAEQMRREKKEPGLKPASLK